MKHICPCCKREFSTYNTKKLHIEVFHPEAKNFGIGKKFQRIVGNIEKCFIQHQHKNIEVLTLSEIRTWMLDNTKNGLSKQRLSNFLRRRPQFNLVHKSRLKNTNYIETWWSLGEPVKQVDIDSGTNWVDIPLN